MYRNRK